jgi:Patatin-like phospholipase
MNNPTEAPRDGPVNFHRVLATELRYLRARRDRTPPSEVSAPPLLARAIWEPALRDVVRKRGADTLAELRQALQTAQAQPPLPAVPPAVSDQDETQRPDPWPNLRDTAARALGAQVPDHAFRRALPAAVSAMEARLGRSLSPAERDALGEKTRAALEAVWTQVLKEPLEKAAAIAFQDAYADLAPTKPPPTRARARNSLQGLENKVLDDAEDRALRQAERHALDMNLVGLAFSGGGIRSATFCLGVLQGLADSELLGRFDYLSTVSGGGYIGSWLAAWIKREGDPDNVEQQLKPSRIDQAQAERQDVRKDQFVPLAKGQIVNEEPEPIYHLRAYSNYLAPRPGVLSADGWGLIAIYLRNFLLNHLVLLPAVLAVLLVTRMAVVFYGWKGSPKTWDRWLAALMVGCAILVLAAIYLWLRRLRLTRVAPRPVKQRLRIRIPYLHLLILAPLLLASFLCCWYILYEESDPLLWPWIVELLPWTPRQVEAWEAAWLPADEHPRAIVLYAAFFGALAGGGFLLLAVKDFVMACAISTRIGRFGQGSPAQAWQQCWRSLWGFVSSILAGALGGTLIYVLLVLVLFPVFAADAGTTLEAASNIYYGVPPALTFGPPVILGAFVLASIIKVGLLGRYLPEHVREWRASLSGWIMIYALVWTSVFGVSLFGVPLLYCLGYWGKVAVGSTWLVTAIGGVLAARSPRTGAGKNNKLLEWLALIAPHVFIAGLLVFLSWLLNWLLALSALSDTALAPLPEKPQLRLIAELNRYFDTMNDADPLILCYWLLGCSALSALMTWCVDVNLFSLQGTYANRLVRCYLGASRPKGERPRHRLRGAPTNSAPPVRAPDLITGFDPHDDFPLHDLLIGEALVGNGAAASRGRPYWGPFPLINTALNLVHGEELAWQERKAEAFVVTPVFCGSETTGYRALPEFGANLSLGTAVSLSGAAASPNMGYHSSSAVTALLTVFNVRLGAWYGNPSRGCWRNSGPRFALAHLVKELFGRTDARSDYVYLSDGGHFENLGVYELVRRRCRFIVLCDAGADPDFEFFDLAGLLRKCRTDFGIRIHLDVRPLHRQGDEQRSCWHCAIGTIHYDDVDPGAGTGTLVYLKPSLTGDEPTDILHYQRENPLFPHQPTANQFFNESEFESYRALGHHICQRAFRDAVKDIENRAALSPAEFTQRLFANLRHRWYPPPPNAASDFVESTKAFIDIHAMLRTDDSLRKFSRDIYGEVSQQLAAAGDDDIVQLHVVSQMLQVMENAWLRLNLDEHHQYPLYSGWMEAFRRWTKAKAFHRHWATLKKEYGEGFVRFCQRELSLPADVAANGPAKAGTAAGEKVNEERPPT